MSTLLLFANMSDFLGEVRLRDGAMEHVMLTHTGEERFGAEVKDWQTRGVPVRREIFGTPEHPKDVVFFQERIQPRDRGFAEALALWCSDHQITSVHLSSPIHASCWTTLLRLPFKADERFVVMNAIIDASADELIAWQGFLREAEQGVLLEKEKADLAVLKLHQKTAESLAKRFAKASKKTA